MKKQTFPVLACCVSLVVVFLVCGGCITGQSEEPVYFILKTAPHASSTERGLLAGDSFYVTQTEIPAYLDGTRIVTRTSVNQLSYAEFHRWSETLDLGITRVLATDLGLTLRALNYSYYPNRPRPNNLFEISVTVQRFEGFPDGKIHFDGSWRLFRNREQILIEPIEETVEIEDSGHAAAVAAMSAALEAISVRIAKRLEEAFEKKALEKKALEEKALPKAP